MTECRAPLRFAAALALAAFACSGSGGGNGGPTTPDPPVVSGIAPAEARVGESITISGSGFGTSAPAVAVTIRGTAAPVASVSATAITVTVPEIAPGSATVAVTVGGSAAGQAELVVAQSPLVITSIEPASIRAGEEVTIRGEGFLAPVGALAPANGVMVSIITDEAIETLPANVRDFRELAFLVPAHTPPGDHTIEVEVGDQTAQRAGVEFHVPPIRGSFAGIGTITSNSFNGLPVGYRTTNDFTLEETFFDRTAGTGTLTGTVNGLYTLEGTFDRFGAFELGGPIRSDRNYFFTGTFSAGSGEPFTHTGVLAANGPGGEQLRFEYDDPSPRWSDQLIPVTKLTVAFGDIVTGNGTLPSATYQYDAYDPVSWTPEIAVSGQLTGTWLMGTNPVDHFGTKDGILRVFYGDIEIHNELMAVIREYKTALNSSQSATQIGYDAAGNEIVRNTFGPIDNQGLVNPVPWGYPPPFPAFDHGDLVPEGNGFTTVIQAGAFLMPADRPASDVAARQAAQAFE